MTVIERLEQNVTRESVNTIDITVDEWGQRDVERLSAQLNRI